jgi:hypothetical protein
MSLNHARHNKNAFSFLRTSTNRFYDWEVTTAFYSALQYINAELFPKQYENPLTKRMQFFNSFDDYYRIVKKTDNDINKHSLLQEMVEEYLPEIRDDYRTLKENCWTARYDNYQIEEEIANLALECLDNISILIEPVEL